MSDEFVGVFHSTFLPRGVRVREEDGDIEHVRDQFVLGELTTIVCGYRFEVFFERFEQFYDGKRIQTASKMTGNPKQLRCVVVYNEKKGFTVELLTNNFNWAASTIGELYKSRWLVEIFFRHVKQLLHIKSFVGTSQNAVEIQLWTALITILMLKYLQFKASYDWNLSNLVASLR